MTSQPGGLFQNHGGERRVRRRGCGGRVLAIRPASTGSSKPMLGNTEMHVQVKASFEANGSAAEHDAPVVSLEPKSELNSRD